MKKQYLFIFAIVFLIIVQASSVHAFFTPEHTIWTINALDNNEGIVSSVCADKKQIVVDGNFAADIFVIHYTDSDKVSSYISTHTRGAGYQNCMEWAGSDEDLICFCYGIGLHNTQDHFSHDTGGLTPKYISKYFSSNLGGHMTVEDDYDLKFLKLKSNDPLITSGEFTQYDKALLDTTVFSDKKFLELLTRMSGLTESEVLRDANLIANGYKGQGFYNTVYKEKLTLPSTFWVISLIALIVPLILLFTIMYIPWLLGIQKTKWRFVLYVFLIILSIIGLLLIISIYSGSTWQWIRLTVRAIPISITQNDIGYYDRIVTQATANFVKQCVLLFDDNTGLSYYDRLGNFHEGALGISEKPFLYIGIPLIIGLLLSFFIFLVFKTFNKKPINNKFLRFLNILGYIIFFSVLIVIAILVFNLIIFK